MHDPSAPGSPPRRLRPPATRGLRLAGHLMVSLSVSAFYGVYAVFNCYLVLLILARAAGIPAAPASVTGLLADPLRHLNETGRILGAFSELSAAGTGIFDVLKGVTQRPEVLGRLLSTILLFFRNSLLTIFFLSRRFSRETSGHPAHWAAAVGGTFVGYLFLVAPTPSSTLSTLSGWIMAAGALLAVAAVGSLGRSFGIVPSNRGVRTGGFYRLVRHPMYGAYMILDIGFLVGNPSLRNLLVFVSFVLLSYYRAVYEESLLAGDAEYQAYLGRVRHRFLPGVF